MEDYKKICVAHYINEAKVNNILTRNQKKMLYSNKNIPLAKECKVLPIQAEYFCKIRSFRLTFIINSSNNKKYSIFSFIIFLYLYVVYCYYITNYVMKKYNYFIL